MQWLFIQHLFANANKQKCARKQIGVNVSSNFLTHTHTHRRMSIAHAQFQWHASQKQMSSILSTFSCTALPLFVSSVSLIYCCYIFMFYVRRRTRHYALLHMRQRLSTASGDLFVELYTLIRYNIPHFHTLTDDELLAVLYKQQPSSHSVTFRQANLRDVESIHSARSCSELNL